MKEKKPVWYIMGEMQGLHDSNLLLCPCPTIGEVNYESKKEIQEIYKDGYLSAYTNGIFKKLAEFPNLANEIADRLAMAREYTEKDKPKQKVNQSNKKNNSSIV